MIDFVLPQIRQLTRDGVMGKLSKIAVTAAVGASSIVVLSASPAHAYCTKDFNRWKYSSYTLIERPSIPSSWRASVKNAMKQWNGIHGSTLKYYGPTVNGNIANPAFSIYRSNFANAGLPDVPGITLGADQTSRHTSAVVILNTRFKWNTTGVLNQAQRKVDVWTVAVHEMGHAGGLAHPWACDNGAMTNAEKASAMNVTWKKKRYPNSDDKAGIAKLY